MRLSFTFELKDDSLVESIPSWEESALSGSGYTVQSHLKSSDILSLLLEVRLVSDKLAPVSSRQAWNDCLGSTLALSRPVRDWDR